MAEQKFDLNEDAIMYPYREELAGYCSSFSCGDADLDDFFAKDAFHYDVELLGRTYAWVNAKDTTEILGLVTLANDSIKTGRLPSSVRNRLQRGITNQKRGRSYPAVLIGRLGVSSECRGKGMSVGSQILDYLKDWFRSSDNKTGCRFIVVDAYNNPQTLHFYEKNGFKPLYKTEQDERDFFNLDSDEQLDTRFFYFDLKW